MSKENPDIKALVVLHSFGEKDFEVIEIEFPKLKDMSIEEQMCIAGVVEMAIEDLGDYGEVIKDINEELWSKNPNERYYCLKINLYYKCTRDYWGEVDTEVDYDYELSNIKTEWEHLDFLQKGDKIYYIDYEDSKSSYTIVGIFAIDGNEVQRCGIYYTIHSDLLPNMTGYYPILVEEIDNQDENNRFFSDIEKAHNAYEKFKERIKK